MYRLLSIRSVRLPTTQRKLTASTCARRRFSSKKEPVKHLPPDFDPSSKTGGSTEFSAVFPIFTAVGLVGITGALFYSGMLDNTPAKKKAEREKRLRDIERKKMEKFSATKKADEAPPVTTLPSELQGLQELLDTADAFWGPLESEKEKSTEKTTPVSKEAESVKKETKPITPAVDVESQKPAKKEEEPVEVDEPSYEEEYKKLTAKIKQLREDNMLHANNDVVAILEKEIETVFERNLDAMSDAELRIYLSALVEQLKSRATQEAVR